MNKIILALLIAIVSCSNLRNLAAFDFNTFYTDLVDKHNALRKKHSAGSLVKLEAIAKLAQKTVDNCKSQGDLIHSGLTYNDQPLGQNLYLSVGAPTASAVADSWYSENKNYNYATGKSKNNGVIGHFTQLVWKSSKKIGCAVAVGTWKGYKNSYFVGCNYYPAGNYANEYTKNVGKPIS
jgi:uncharacterized protein YkwD